MRPLPATLRLSTTEPGSKPPTPPFGLRAWSTEGERIAVLLDAGRGDRLDLGQVVDQVPSASGLPARTPMVVLAGAVRHAGTLRRLFGGGTVQVARATRCSALIARGYVDVGGGVDEPTGADSAWGWSP